MIYSVFSELKRYLPLDVLMKRISNIHNSIQVQRNDMILEALNIPIEITLAVNILFSKILKFSNNVEEGKISIPE